MRAGRITRDRHNVWSWLTLNPSTLYVLCRWSHFRTTKSIRSFMKFYFQFDLEPPKPEQSGTKSAMVDIFWSMSTKKEVLLSKKKMEVLLSRKRVTRLDSFPLWRNTTIYHYQICGICGGPRATWHREQQSEYLNACCMTQWAPSAKLECARFS